MKALLIAGDGRFFLDEAQSFRRYLKKEVGMEDIVLIKTAYLSLPQLWKRVRDALDPQKANGPLLLVYVGHGAEDGWGVSFCNTFSYMTFVDGALKEYPEPIVFVNDCCYAATPIKWFDHFGISKEKMSFIAAVSEKEKVEPGLMRRVRRSWRQHRIHQPSIRRLVSVDADKPMTESEQRTSEVRWGGELDSFFFSKLLPDPARDGLRKMGTIVVDPARYGFGSGSIVDVPPRR